MKKTLKLINLILLLGMMAGCAKQPAILSKGNEPTNNGDGSITASSTVSGDSSASASSATSGDGSVNASNTTSGDGSVSVSNATSGDGSVSTGSATNGDGSASVSSIISGDGSTSVKSATNKDGSATINSSTMSKNDSTVKNSGTGGNDSASKNSTVSKDTSVSGSSAVKKVEENVVTLAIYDHEGTILSPIDVSLNEGDTVFKVLKRTLKEQKIQMEFSGSDENAYIQGINNIYEFDEGSGSGWMFSVNGVYISESCGAYVLEKGDKIEWHYTLDLGKDLGVTLS